MSDRVFRGGFRGWWRRVALRASGVSSSCYRSRRKCELLLPGQRESQSGRGFSARPRQIQPSKKDRCFFFIYHPPIIRGGSGAVGVARPPPTPGPATPLMKYGARGSTRNDITTRKRRFSLTIQYHRPRRRRRLRRPAFMTPAVTIHALRRA